MLRNALRIHNTKLSSHPIHNFKHYKPILLETVHNPLENHPRKRHFSFQTSVESAIRTQSGIFKSLSESAPVEGLQKFLLSFHDWTGLPWWATVVCASVLMRTTVTVPLAIYQYYILAKLENLRLKMPAIAEELKQEVAVAVKMYNWDENTARFNYNKSIRKQWNDLVVQENCHPFKATLLVWFQIPMWISFSVALRNLVYMLPHGDIQAKLTFTELTMGGFGFIPNLTEVDSSLILPVTLGVVNLAIIEFQLAARKNEPSKVQRILTNVFRGFSVLMIPISASVPSCLVLYWCTSSLFGLIQNLVLISPKIRRFCRIPKTDSELENPYKYAAQKLKNKFNVLN